MSAVEGRQADRRPPVSAVIITRDRHELLERCVRSIIDNTYRPLQIVIVDNGSTESQRAIEAFLYEIESDVLIEHLVTPPISFAQMRQMTVDHSTGDYLLSIDDDCVAHPDAVANMVRRFEADPAIGVVGGNIENVGFEGTEQFKGRGRIGTNGYYEPMEDPYQAEVFGGGNASIRRSALLEIGGYDPFFSGGLDDADAVLSIRERGYRVEYAPDVRITHYHTPARYRKLWRNINVMRLYLFFKHDMPGTLAAWLHFAVAETGFYLRDVWHLISTFRLPLRSSDGFRASAVRMAKLTVLRAIELIKVTLARLMIPYLAWRAGRGRFPNPD